MINWTAPKPKPRKRFVSRQSVMAEKGAERAKIKTYMAAADGHDQNNLYWADQWLRERAELGEDHHRIKYAIAVMARLRPELEF